MEYVALATLDTNYCYKLTGTVMGGNTLFDIHEMIQKRIVKECHCGKGEIKDLEITYKMENLQNWNLKK